MKECSFLFFCRGVENFIEAVLESSLHMGRLALGFDRVLNHVISSLDCTVEILEDLHVVDIPIVTGFHLCNGKTKVTIEFFCDFKDAGKALLFFRSLLFHHLKCGFQMLDALGCLGVVEFKITDTVVLL